MRKIVWLGAVLLTVACGDSPTGPSPVSPEPERSAGARPLASFYTAGCSGQCRIDAALALLDYATFSAPLPWTSERSAGAWLRAQQLTIRLAPELPSGVAADCCSDNRTMRLAPSSLGAIGDDVQLVATAALILHEATHTRVGHPCGGVKDNTVGDMGAWAVSVYTFEWFATQAANMAIDDATRGELMSFANAIRASQFCG